MSEKPTNHYVDNVAFAQALTERRKKLKLLGPEDQKPVLSNYLAKCLLDICKNLSYKSNFIGYSYREEMVSDALENCLRVVDNYDAENSPYAFAYFTTVAFRAFLRRIAMEKKQSYIKGKLLAEMPIEDLIEVDESTGETYNLADKIRDNYYFSTDAYEKTAAAKKQKKTEKANLEKFMKE